MGNDAFLNITKFFLAGAVLGGGAALLLAPQSGERTRRAIRRKREDVTDAVADARHGLAAKYRAWRKELAQACACQQTA